MLPKKAMFVLLLLPLLLLATIIQADDDEREEEDDREQQVQQVVQQPLVEATQTTNQAKIPAEPKPTTQTVIPPVTTPVNTEVTQKVEQIIKPDTDGDGLIDELDPHPIFAEVYIVQDNNQNGIVDAFEQLMVNL